MEIFLTILAGSCTFVVGQIIIKLFIEPVQELQKSIADVSNKLILHANIYANPKPAGDEKQKEMSMNFRNVSSILQSNMHLIPAYNITRYIFGLPSKKNIVDAAKSLIFIHNGHDGVLENQGILNCYAAQKARISLKIFIPEGEYLNPEHEASFVKAKNN